MAMTRQHFNAIAETMRENMPNENWLNKRQQWETDVRALADMCHDASNFTPNGNRAFDRDRFLKACGIVEG